MTVIISIAALVLIVLNISVLLRIYRYFNDYRTLDKVDKGPTWREIQTASNCIGNLVCGSNSIPTKLEEQAKQVLLAVIKKKLDKDIGEIDA